MGLDMYLEKRLYVKKWEHTPPEKTFDVEVKRGGKIYDGINKDKISQIIEDVGYWRKANAIHSWFVENVQDGNDDCKEYYITREKLKELLDTVNKVLDSSTLREGLVKNGESLKDGKWVANWEKGKIMENTKIAKELLPTQEGFFFGGTDYNEWYYNDLLDTKKILEDCLNNESNGDFYYSSSW